MAMDRGFAGTLSAAGAMAVALIAAAPAGATAARPPLLATGVSAPSSTGPQAATIDPLYGRISAFRGDVNPLYGRISAFWGDVSPFYGRISAFWGDLNPLYGRISAFGGIEAYYGRISAFESSADPFGALMTSYEGDLVARYGRISAFDGDMRPFLGHVGAFWHLAGAHWRDTSALWGAAGSDVTQLAAVKGRLDDFHARSAAFWGAAAQRSGGFDALAAGIYAKHGIDRADPASLTRLSASDRTLFFLDWYDGLMGLSGTDHVDHWMATIGWTPAITQVQGGGRDARIGLLDFAVTGDLDITAKTVTVGGSADGGNGHGAAVASLIVASHDGRGVMGIAPGASVRAYNPFNRDGTADWASVTAGIRALTGAGVGVLNMSLGVPGYTLHPDWAKVFGNGAIRPALGATVFVIAAGNDGFTQQRSGAPVSTGDDDDGGYGDLGGGVIEDDDVEDGYSAGAALAANPALIVVGSVDPSGTISAFSNRPGDACVFERKGTCDANGLLAERFITAPGELILVSDNAGGVERASGTSFAAPLVSGTIALLHDRWPWLRHSPRAAVAIILRSARDLGAPGTDPVYGRGLLDVAASQSPLDFGALTFIEKNGTRTMMRTATSLRQRGVNSTWEANGAYLTAFEFVGGSFRDFAIPLSTRLSGRRVGSSGEYFQSYVTSRFQDWLGRRGFADRDVATTGSDLGGFTFAMTAGTRPLTETEAQGDERFAATRGIALGGPSFGFKAGFGEGALALAGSDAFGLFSDHDPERGGVNPLLGFASGGAYAGGELKVAPGLTLAAGLTEQRERDRRGEIEGPAVGALDPTTRAYSAQAAHLALSWRASPRATLTAGLTALDEPDALLGIQSSVPSDLDGGSTSLGLTTGAAFELGRGFGFATSASVARTRAAARDGGIGTTPGGLWASAFQVAMTKDGVFGGDRLRVSLAQPLHVETGQLEYTAIGVVDRDTGALGPVTQRFDAGVTRRFVGEALYAVGLPGLGEVSAFGRLNLGGTEAARDAGEGPLVIGGRWNVRF